MTKSKHTPQKASGEQDVQKLEARISELELIVQKQEQELTEYKNIFESVSQRLQHLTRQMKEDLKTLKNLQLALVPKELPNVHGFEISTRFMPGQKWGGDYYDLIPGANRQQFTLLVSSASSFGLSALVLSVLVAFIPRMEAQQSQSVEDFQGKLLKMIQKIQEHMEPGDEWHLFYSFIDAQDMRVHSFIFGEMPVGVLRKNGFEVLASPLPAITKETELLNFSPLETSIHPGNCLIVGSRGVELEAPNIFSQIFLEPRQWENVHDLRNQIFKEIFQVQKGMRNPRDLTLVVLHQKQQGMRLVFNKQ